MIRRIATFIAIAAFAATAWADTTATSDKVCAEKCATTCSKCPVEAAMAKLPKLTYLVGKESTCCSESAAKLAKEHDAPMKFVVADKTFDDKTLATVALADATEKYVSSFTTPTECKVSGKFTVAGKELCCSVMAGQRAEIAKKAMSQVELAYAVGDQKCSCPNEAAALAKETGKEKVFLVAGEKTCCSVEARLKLAQAKYKAAIEALAKADGVVPADDAS